MKTPILSFVTVPVVFLSVLLLQACRDKTVEEITYQANVPVYMDFSEFRSAVKSTPARTPQHPGKIYVLDNYLFINEIDKGVHVVDNSNPASPQPVAFINIPGNLDLAVKNNILYADSYIDLVAIDISDPANPVEIDRVENAFPNVLPVMDEAIPVYGLDFTKGVVVGWETKEVTEVTGSSTGGYRQSVLYDGLGVPMIGVNEVSFGQSSAGISGSMARFTLSNDYLYSVQNSTLKVFTVQQIPGIAESGAIQLDRQAETLFPYENRLFLGTTTGMMVYDLSNPAIPAFVSVFDHISSCDPVVIEGSLAYVTLRSGNLCNNFTNQLDVVDISSVSNPFLVKSYPMYNPHGLGIENHVLFICDGDAGLKIYDATDPLNIHMNQLAHFPDIKTYDVIPVNGLLIMTGADGIYQYDYSDLSDIKLISFMPVETVDS